MSKWSLSIADVLKSLHWKVHVRKCQVILQPCHFWISVICPQFDASVLLQKFDASLSCFKALVWEVI